MSAASLLESGPPPWLRQAGNDWSAGTPQREGSHATVQRLGDTPGFIGAARASARCGLDVLAHALPITRIVRVDGVDYRLFQALVAGLRPEPVPATPPVSISAMATRFEVARGRVRLTLALAQHRGLLQHDSRAGVVQLRPAFVDLARHRMALEPSWMIGIMRAAAHRLQLRRADLVAQAR